MIHGGDGLVASCPAQGDLVCSRLVAYDAIKHNNMSQWSTQEERMGNVHRHRHRNYQMPHRFLDRDLRAVVRRLPMAGGWVEVNVKDLSLLD